MLIVIFQVLSCLALNISDYTLQVQIRYRFTMDNLLVGQFAGCFVAAHSAECYVVSPGNTSKFG